MTVTKKTKPAVEEPPFKKKRTVVADLSGEDAAKVSDLYDRKKELLGLLTEINKIVKVNNISLSTEDRCSTGNLCLNLLMGGGIAPGMYTFYGPEQSSKTTSAINILGASIGEEVDLRVLWDAENSSGSSTDYIENIFNTMGVKASVSQIFEGDIDNGEMPLVIYRDDYEAEKFFDWVHALQKRLPDKRFDDDKWWYVYDETPANKTRLAGKYDKRKSSQMQGGYWMPAEDGRLQAIILLDSYPSLVPTKMDSDEGDKSIAVQARMFSKQIPRIKGAFRAKRIAMIGVNQLRINPMARFGNPETEPCGQALKFFSDVRLRYFPRALSGVPFNPKGEKNKEREASVEFDGEDVYRYIHVGATKNKLSKPGRETWIRLWESDGDGKARGYCTVWDTFYYLVQTGQVTGKRSQMKLNLTGKKFGEATRTISWQELKILVLGSKKEWAAIYARIGYPVINLRAGCFKQLKSGTGEEMYINHNKPSKNLKGSEDDDESSDE